MIAIWQYPFAGKLLKGYLNNSTRHYREFKTVKSNTGLKLALFWLRNEENLSVCYN